MKNSKRITPLAAAKVYLVAEVSKIFPEEGIQNQLASGIDRLSPERVGRLLKALSSTYRGNRVFSYLNDPGFDWQEEEISCDNIILTSMGPSIDRVIRSKSVRRSPARFCRYLLDYFKQHPNDDPEKLGQFRPDGRAIQYPTVFVFRDHGDLKMLDGSNRLIASMLQGGKVIKAIVGKKVVKAVVGKTVIKAIVAKTNSPRAEDTL